MKYLRTPYRNLVVSAGLLFGLMLSIAEVRSDALLYVFAVLGAIPIVFKATKDIFRSRKITIEVFNSVVLIASFGIEEPKSAAFIVLMLTFADYLDWKTETRSHRAIEELFRLNPIVAIREKDGKLEDVSVSRIEEGDVIVVENGARIPVDGKVIYGSALVNESSISGESVPIEKVAGDKVFSSTLNETGLIKITATGVGKNSTIERMAELIKGATKHKSRTEKIADRFAGFFLPLLLVLGAAVFFYTRDLRMVVSLFLVACADDMAVAIPLAITASLGRAARRGIVVKGGEWLDAMSRVDTIVFDKTGTLTYGTLNVKSVHYASGVNEDDFWRKVAIAEKFSEHPAGHAMYREGARRLKNIPDPEDFKVVPGAGVYAKYDGTEIIIGNEKMMSKYGIEFSGEAKEALAKERTEHKDTASLVHVNGKYYGVVAVADVVHPEAKKSIQSLSKLGVKKMKVFTGDNEETAGRVASGLGIADVVSKMTPEEKMIELESLLSTGAIVGMVGDGINDAPSLARADVGIAMGGGGIAVAVEAADVVILKNSLDRIPELVSLSRKTMSVIRWDIAIWIISNALGFVLVFSGLIGPVFAAFYNFVTDFFPLINSARLFREKI